MQDDRTISQHTALPRASRIHRLLLVHASDPAVVGQGLLLGDAPLTVGRAGHVQGPLGLDDRTLSRRHAVFEPAEDGWTLRDLGSHNGTFVGGERIEHQALHHGTVVRAGDAVVLYEIHQLEATEPLAPEAGPLFGASIAMQRVRAELALAAARDLPVLLQGESGVGKELAASMLHDRSARKGRFVPVNCGALPGELVESELFGHVAGAFSGATGARPGLFSAAEGGTLFLDEIGEMPLETQPKLLRALATGEVRPVGSEQPRRIDVRVVAATHRELAEVVEQGAFRGDLYSRLAAWTIRIPSLRERRADVLSLVPRLGDPQIQLSANAAEALMLHDWPYNVRELRQVLATSAARAAEGGCLRVHHLPAPIRGPIEERARVQTTDPVPLALRVDCSRTPDHDDLDLVMRHHDGNVSEVARFFGKQRQQIYRWIERLGIDPDSYR